VKASFGYRVPRCIEQRGDTKVMAEVSIVDPAGVSPPEAFALPALLWLQAAYASPAVLRLDLPLGFGTTAQPRGAVWAYAKRVMPHLLVRATGPNQRTRAG
jgi:hypothetical protein